MIRFCNALRARRPRDRQAALLLAMLVCLALAMMLFSAWLRTIALAHRHVRAQDHALQAEFMADSALARAAAQLAAEPGYTGETWNVEAGPSGLRGGGAAVIRVEAVTDRPQARRVTVEALVPAEGAHRARRTLQEDIETNTVGEAS